MHRLTGRAALGATLALACLPAPGVAASRVQAAAELPHRVHSAYLPGEAIVRFERGTSAAERRNIRQGADVEFESGLQLARTEIVELDGSVPAAVRRLERQPDVAYAQPNYRYSALAVPAPNDPRFGQLWGLEDPDLPDPGVSVLETWDTTKGEGQVIAIADTGVDLTHPDLVLNLWSNGDEQGGIAGVDDDLNGSVDDIHGYDFVDDDGDPDDYQFHGTHVAGTAAAVAGNGLGIAGVAPDAEIMAVRVLDGDGSGSSAEIADGIAYATKNGATVINLSLGGPAGAGDFLMSTAIGAAAAKDVVVVAAAGNEAADNDTEPHTPCALSNQNLVCVAALNRNGSLSSFSNYGAQSVDIAAPGGGDVSGGGIVSAKADYRTLLSSGFESGFGSIWQTEAFDGGIEWDQSPRAASGSQSATDSEPGTYGQGPPNPSERAVSVLFTVDPVDLNGERGCRLHFQTMYEIEPPAPNGALFDAFVAGAFGEGLTAPEAFRLFVGRSPGYLVEEFEGEEVSISALDDRADAHPFFEILSDEELEFDGAYVDDVLLLCRDDTYDASNYVSFSGTSMATPHVAGVVALVRAAKPGLSADGAIAAVLTGASALPNPVSSRRTATEGIADACQAVAVATGSANPLGECPGSSENVLPQSPVVPTAGSGGAGQIAPSPPPPDTEPPQTSFKRRPPRVVGTRGRRARVVFRFGANEPGVTFLCRVDRGSFRRCPARFVRRFGIGRHVVRVKARDVAGNVDRSPAVWRFRVQRRR